MVSESGWREQKRADNRVPPCTPAGRSRVRDPLCEPCLSLQQRDPDASSLCKICKACGSERVGWAFRQQSPALILRQGFSISVEAIKVRAPILSVFNTSMASLVTASINHQSEGIHKGDKEGTRILRTRCAPCTWHHLAMLTSFNRGENIEKVPVAILQLIIIKTSKSSAYERADSGLDGLIHLILIHLTETKMKR